MSTQPFTKVYNKGACLFHENDHSRELYIIQTGRVRVYRSCGAREIELAVLGTGAVLGEMALIDGKPRSASAMALEASSVVIIDADTFFSKIRNVPPWFLTIIRIVSEKIRKADKRLNQAIEEKTAISITLAVFYLFSQFGTGERHRPSIELATAQRRLIQLLSLSSQHIVGVLGFLQAHDFVTINEHLLTCTDSERLRMYCVFLRRHLRKTYQNTPPLSVHLKELLSAAVQEAPRIQDESADQIELDYQPLIERLPHRPDENQSAGILDKLQELGLCRVVKKRREDGAGTTATDAVLHISCRPWQDLHLYARYGEMVPRL